MRYRGPEAKVMRRFGIALAPSPEYQRILEKRPHRSYQVRPGETITISEKMKRSRQMAEWSERGAVPPPLYLELDREQLAGRLVRLPERDEIPIPIDDRLIVEFYSR